MVALVDGNRFSQAQQASIDATSQHGAGRLGRASLRALEGELEAVARWGAECHDPQKSPLAAFLASLLAKKTAAFFGEQDPVRLEREWDDEQRRLEARAQPDGQGKFLAYVDGLVNECRWWPTPGSDIDDFRQQCRLAAFEALSREDGFSAFEVPGEAATLLLCRRERDRMRSTARKDRRRTEVMAELRPAMRTPEDDILADERRRAISQVLPEMEAGANKAQRRWLETLGAQADQDHRLVPAKAARKLGRNRSSATRALVSLQELAMASSAARYVVEKGRAPGRLIADRSQSS
jgi:hypothetical protein